MKLSLFGFSAFIAATMLFASWGLNTHFSSGPLKSSVTVVIPRNWVIAHNQYFNPKRDPKPTFVFKLAAKLLGKSKKLRAGEYF